MLLLLSMLLTETTCFTHGHSHRCHCPCCQCWPHVATKGVSSADHVWPPVPLPLLVPLHLATRGHTCTHGLCWPRVAALYHLTTRGHSHRCPAQEENQYLETITGFTDLGHRINQLDMRAQEAADELAAYAQGAADLTIPAVEGTTLPQFLQEPGQNVYGRLPEPAPMPLFDIDALHLRCPWQALKFRPQLLGMHVNLSSRGSFVDGDVLRGYVMLVDGPTKVFMPIGGTAGSPCYRNRWVTISPHPGACSVAMCGLTYSFHVRALATPGHSPCSLSPCRCAWPRVAASCVSWLHAASPSHVWPPMPSAIPLGGCPSLILVCCDHGCPVTSTWLAAHCCACRLYVRFIRAMQISGRYVRPHDKVYCLLHLPLRVSTPDFLSWIALVDPPHLLCITYAQKAAFGTSRKEYEVVDSIITRFPGRCKAPRDLLWPRVATACGHTWPHTPFAGPTPLCLATRGHTLCLACCACVATCGHMYR